MTRMNKALLAATGALGVVSASTLIGGAQAKPVGAAQGRPAAPARRAVATPVVAPDAAFLKQVLSRLP